MPKNPFGEELPQKSKVNPFGEDADEGGPEGAATRIEHAARKLRGLRHQAGAEGLSVPATRELLDEVATALDAAARAIRDLAR